MLGRQPDGVPGVGKALQGVHQDRAAPVGRRQLRGGQLQLVHAGLPRLVLITCVLTVSHGDRLLSGSLQGAYQVSPNRGAPTSNSEREVTLSAETSPLSGVIRGAPIRGPHRGAPANLWPHRDARKSARRGRVRHDEGDARTDPDALLGGGGGGVADVVPPARRARVGCPGVRTAGRRPGAAAQPARAEGRRGSGGAGPAHRGDLHRRWAASCLHRFGAAFRGRQPHHHRRALPGRGVADHVRSRLRRRRRTRARRRVEGRRGVPRSALDQRQGSARRLRGGPGQQRQRRRRRVPGRVGADAGRHTPAGQPGHRAGLSGRRGRLADRVPGRHVGHRHRIPGAGLRGAGGRHQRGALGQRHHRGRVDRRPGAGGCAANMSYSAPFDAQTAELLARAEAGGPGDPIPNDLQDAC